MSGGTIIWIVAIVCITIIAISNNIRRSSYGSRHHRNRNLDYRVELLEKEVHNLRERMNEKH